MAAGEHPEGSSSAAGGNGHGRPGRAGDGGGGDDTTAAAHAHDDDPELSRATGEPAPAVGGAALAEGVEELAEARAALRRAEEVLVSVHHARLRVRRSEERYALAARATRDVLWDWNVRSGRVLCSEALSTRLGHGAPRGGYVLTSLEKLLALTHPEDRPRVERSLFAALESGADSWTEDYRFRHGSGTWAYLHNRAFVVRDPEGRPVRLVGSMMDITRRRRAEEERERALGELAAKEALLTAVLEQLPSGVVVAHADGTLALANARASGLLRSVGAVGTRLQEVPRGWRVFAADGRPLTREAWPIGRSLATGEVVRHEELHLHRPDGTRLSLSVSSAPVRSPDGAHILAAVATFEDITERKRAEAEAAERAAFEQQLIGIVSHDLRNPMHAVSLGVELLLQRGDVGEGARPALKRLRASAARAMRLITDLLDFTQARLGGGLPVAPRPLDLADHAAAVLDEVRLAHPGRYITLGAEGDTRGAWDPDRVAQVLTNLVGNALKYSPPDSTVRVRVQGDEDAVLLEVHNAGEPIPPEVQRALFQPLQRGTTTHAADTDPQRRSVGLGLYIVDQVVRAHGGVVDVHSAAEEGTTFTVRLPREPPPARLAPAGALAPEQDAGAGAGADTEADADAAPAARVLDPGLH